MNAGPVTPRLAAAGYKRCRYCTVALATHAVRYTSSIPGFTCSDYEACLSCGLETVRRVSRVISPLCDGNDCTADCRCWRAIATVTLHQL